VGFQECQVDFPVLSSDTSIEGALGSLAGVSQVNVDIPTKAVQITYDPEAVTLAKIEEVLDDTGYTVAK
jgi:copper chaperone CopZ